MDLAWTPSGPLRARQFGKRLSGTTARTSRTGARWAEGGCRGRTNQNHRSVAGRGYLLPICYEELVRRLNLAIPHDEDTLRFHVERVTIEPFNLRQPSRFDVVIDRLTHWYHTSREWIKKAILLNDLYVFNNPWSLQSNEKQTTYCAMMRLGLPVPDTWLIPPMAYRHSADLQPTLERYARYFDLGEIGRQCGFPLFMKPFDGGAWVGVSKIDNEQELWRAYEHSGTLIMNLQAGVVPYDYFVRCVGLGPQTR